MSLSARLAKLEATHTRILRCLWCRYSLRPVPAREQKRYNASPKSVLLIKCWFCGTRYLAPLRGLNQHQREVVELIYNSHPTKQYNDERVHAAGLWFSLYRSEVASYEQTHQERAERTVQKHPTPSHNRARGPLTAKEEKAKREREELKQKANEFREAELARFKRLAGGPDSFPIDQTIKEIEERYRSSGYDKPTDELILSLGFEKYSSPASHLRAGVGSCNYHLSILKKREACEVMLWSAALPETLEEIAFFEQKTQEVIKEAVEIKKTEDERRAQEKAEAERRRLEMLQQNAGRGVSPRQW